MGDMGDQLVLLQTLWAKRDFKLINGAFVSSRITSLKYCSASQSVDVFEEEVL